MLPKGAEAAGGAPNGPADDEPAPKAKPVFALVVVACPMLPNEGFELTDGKGGPPNMFPPSDGGLPKAIPELVDDPPKPEDAPNVSPFPELKGF